MKFALLSLLLVLVGCQPKPPISVELYFSPSGGCTEAVVRELSKAQKSVRVQAYSFTSAPIAEAVVACQRRHVDTKVILDRSQRSERYSSLTFLTNNVVPTLIDAKHAIAHNKIIIIDGEVVLTGSFNFTKAAEKNNAENLLVIHDKSLAARYLENWQAHEAHSE